MPENSTGKKDQGPTQQTLWGHPQNWVRSTETLSPDSETRITTGHDRVEEIRLHPVLTKHLVPGNPGGAIGEADLPPSFDYSVTRYSFEINKSVDHSLAVGEAKVIWYHSYNIGHFSSHRSRMKARCELPLASVEKNGLWTPRAHTAVVVGRKSEPS